MTDHLAQYRFHENEAMRLALDNITSHIHATKSRGDTIPHEEIESVSGVMRHNRVEWGWLISRLRKRLLREHGWAFIQTPDLINVGYKLPTETEQVEECGRNRAKRSARQAHKGIREVGAVEPGNLPMHLQRARARRIHQLREARKSARRAARDVADKVLSPQEAMPKRPMR